MIVLVMAISNLVLTRQIYSGETNGAHAHYREPVPLREKLMLVTLGTQRVFKIFLLIFVCLHWTPLYIDCSLIYV